MWFPDYLEGDQFGTPPTARLHLSRKNIQCWLLRSHVEWLHNLANMLGQPAQCGIVRDTVVEQLGQKRERERERLSVLSMATNSDFYGNQFGLPWQLIWVLRLISYS